MAWFHISHIHRQIYWCTLSRLCEAFNLVDHNILPQKLHIYQSSESALQAPCMVLVGLCDRKQVVRFNKTLSPEQTVTHGVPQLRLEFLVHYSFSCQLMIFPYMLRLATCIFTDDVTTSVEGYGSTDSKWSTAKGVPEYRIIVYRQ